MSSQDYTSKAYLSNQIASLSCVHGGVVEAIERKVQIQNKEILDHNKH